MFNSEDGGCGHVVRRGMSTMIGERGIAGRWEGRGQRIEGLLQSWRVWPIGKGAMIDVIASSTS